MSAKLAMRVLESALPRELKPTAVVMVLHGNNAGQDIYPGVDLVAYLRDVSPRTIERDLAALRAIGVLRPKDNLRGGRRRTVEYELDVSALPPRAPYKPRRTRRGLQAQNPDTGDGVSRAHPDVHVAKPRRTRRKTPTHTSQNPDVHVTRSSKYHLVTIPGVLKTSCAELNSAPSAPAPAAPATRGVSEPRERLVEVRGPSEARADEQTPAPVLTFPTVGTQGTEWPLTCHQLAEWAALFPGLDLLQEARKALAWIGAHPGRRKTASGMPRFLVGWFSRAVDHGGARRPAAEATIGSGRTGPAPPGKYAGRMKGVPSDGVH